MSFLILRKMLSSLLSLFTGQKAPQGICFRLIMKLGGFRWDWGTAEAQELNKVMFRFFFFFPLKAIFFQQAWFKCDYRCRYRCCVTRISGRKLVIWWSWNRSVRTDKEWMLQQKGSRSILQHDLTKGRFIVHSAVSRLSNSARFPLCAVGL